MVYIPHNNSLNLCIQHVHHSVSATYNSTHVRDPSTHVRDPMSTHVRDPYQGLSFSLSEYEYRGIRVLYVTYCFCATEIQRYSYCRSVFVATTCHTSVVRSPKAPLRNAVTHTVA